MKIKVLTIFLTVSSSLCQWVPLRSQALFPDETWENATPASQQVNEAPMLEALDFLKSKSFDDGNEEVKTRKSSQSIESISAMLPILDKELIGH